MSFIQQEALRTKHRRNVFVREAVCGIRDHGARLAHGAIALRNE